MAESSVAYYCDLRYWEQREKPPGSFRGTHRVLCCSSEQLARAAYESLLCAVRASGPSVSAAIAMPDQLAKIMELMRIRLGFRYADTWVVYAMG